MKELKLKLVGKTDFKKKVTIDGKEVKLKSNNFGGLDATYTTDKDSVEVAMSKYLELSNPLWLLMSMLFFIVSIFGIFDIRYDSKCLVLSLRFTVKLAEKTTVRVHIVSSKKKGNSIEVTSDNGEISVTENVFDVDKTVRSRYIIQSIIKIAVWIGLVVALVMGIVNYIG